MDGEGDAIGAPQVSREGKVRFLSTPASSGFITAPVPVTITTTITIGREESPLLLGWAPSRARGPLDNQVNNSKRKRKRPHLLPAGFPDPPHKPCYLRRMCLPFS